MSLTVTYMEDLARVRVEGSAIPGNQALLERSTDEIRWEPVRGGAPVPVQSSKFVVDDYEFTPGVPNFYRATPVADETINLGMSGSVTTDGNEAAKTIDDTFTNVYIGGKFIRLTLTIDDVSRVGAISFFLGRHGAFTDYARWQFMADYTGSSTFGRSGERFSIDLKAAEIYEVAGDVTLSATGELEMLSAYNAGRLRVQDDGTGPVNVQLHSVEVVDALATQSYVSITFDDGHDSVMELGKPKMDQLGLFGTTYVIADRVDSDPDTVTSTDLDEMAEDGWEVAGHAYAGAVHGSSYQDVTREEAEDDLAALHEWLKTNYPDPTGRHSFAYPHGKYDTTTDGASIEALVRRAGFDSGRTILSTAGQSASFQIAGIPEVMPYRIHAASSISELSGGQLHPDALTAQGGMLDKAAENPGSWLVLVFHRIIPDDVDMPELLTNSEFETDATDWHAFSGAALGWSGGKATVTPPASGIPSVIEFGRATGTRPSVTPGVTYRVEASASMAWQLDLQPVLRWYDSSGSAISDSEGEIYPGVWNGGATLVVEAEAPPGAASVSPRIWMHDAPSDAYVMSVEYFRMSEAVLPSATSEITKSGFDKVMDAIAARDMHVRTVRDALRPHYAAITPEIGSPWIKSITRPYLNHPVKLFEFGEEQRPSRTGVFNVVGRTYPVAVADVRGSRQQEIQLLTENRDERDALDFILSTGETLYLQMPGEDCPIDSRYITVGNTSVARTAYRHTKRRVFSLPTVEVARPDVSIVGVTNTWSNAVTTHATWADLLGDVDTWSELVDEVAGASDVIVP